MKKLVAAACCSIMLITACGDDDDSASSGTSAFCADVTALGSLGKGASDAMAMQPADAMKDFEALAAKVTALKANAPADLVAAIDTVAARFTLEAKAESMMAADPKGGSEESMMLDENKTKDDEAMAKLIAAAKSTCNADIG
jgi:hypothetical protein